MPILFEYVYFGFYYPFSYKKGLLGKKVGEIAEISVPQGKISLEVMNISL